MPRTASTIRVSATVWSPCAPETVVGARSATRTSVMTRAVDFSIRAVLTFTSSRRTTSAAVGSAESGCPVD